MKDREQLIGIAKRVTKTALKVGVAGGLILGLSPESISQVNLSRSRGEHPYGETTPTPDGLNLTPPLTRVSSDKYVGVTTCNGPKPPIVWETEFERREVGPCPPGWSTEAVTVTIKKRR